MGFYFSERRGLFVFGLLPAVGLFLTAGTIIFSCAYHEFPKPVDCSNSDLAVKILSKLDPATCLAVDGSIAVSASGGDGPYSFSLDGGEFQSNNLFNHLGPGTYTVTGMDVHGCQRLTQINLAASSSTLTASVNINADSECLNDNGSITITASQGKAPYQYQFGNGQFGNVTTFSHLQSGIYTITIKDSTDCPMLISAVVPRANTGVSYVNNIKPILDTYCNIKGCHNGDLGNTWDWQNYNSVKADAENIKLRTSNLSMPIGGSALTQDQIKMIACWVNDGANNN